MNLSLSKTLFYGLLIGTLLSSPAQAINVKQFIEVCASEQVAHKQFCNTYIGGALDAIAVMNDRAKKNGNALYCAEEKEVFDIEKIKSYVLATKAKYADKNAILPVTEYLQSNGKCNANK